MGIVFRITDGEKLDVADFVFRFARTSRPSELLTHKLNQYFRTPSFAACMAAPLEASWGGQMSGGATWQRI